MSRNSQHATRNPEPLEMHATVAVETLGCKVNQYESSYFIELLKEAGYRMVSFREHADVYVVHSCAVTSRASYQTRQLLRRAQRMNPLAVIVVAGCDAQLEPDRIAEERLATHILGSAEKLELVHWLQTPGSLSHPCRGVGNPRSWDVFNPLPTSCMQSGRTRASLKVQDGCDTFCSYCVVPYTRGKSRSLHREEVRAQLDRFLEHGYSEVVLTGIHLGQWGKDLSPAVELVDLLSFLSEGSLPPRVRLSSLEPMEWSAELLAQLSSAPWVCPHFHVPLQSGDEEILKRMHRPYTPRAYEGVIHELHHLFPDAALGADVLVGFPGETEHHFERTYELIHRLPLTYLHVFPFSPRPGTAAFQWPGRAPGREQKRRARALQDLGIRKKHTFWERFVGHWLDVLVEAELKPGWWQGTTRNYLPVFFPSPCSLLPGTSVKVQAIRLTERGLEGKAAFNPP